MGLKTFKPVTPSRRHLILVDRGDLYKGRSEKKLTEALVQHAGRDNHGHITSRRAGGGHKHHYRIVDFKRKKSRYGGGSCAFGI